MTLKTWLSGGHAACHKHHKGQVDIVSPLEVNGSKLTSSKGLTALPNGDVTLRRGIKKPFSTLTKTGGRDWRVRSVEDVVDAEGGDYGFLEYYSLRRTSSRDTALGDTRTALTYGTWNRLNSTWGQWDGPGPAQFYPGTLNRNNKLEKKRISDYNHRNFQLDESWRPEDMRTSTPLSAVGRSRTQTPTAMNLQRQQKTEEGDSNRRQVVKKNSLLWRLRPDRWRTLDGSLRRARSRDDGLDASRVQRKGDLGASQPDLLTSHRAPGDPLCCEITSPAPISILPPTTRRAAHSETLPRRSRHSSKENNGTATLLAKGRRWLNGASLGRADHSVNRGLSELVIQSEAVDPPKYTPNNCSSSMNRHKNLKNAVNSLTVGGHRIYSGIERDGWDDDLWRRGRSRSRRPRTFYLLEDYLSPVRTIGGIPPAGVVLDEYVGRAPRLVFREMSRDEPQRPIPPTPEWDTPSLSPPPSSVLSGHQPTYHNHHSQVPGGRSLFVDHIIPSPEKNENCKIYSPVFSPKDSGYPRFVTPELALPELSLPDRAPPPISGLPQPPHQPCYSHSYRSLDRDERRRARDSRKSPAHHHHHHHHHKDSSLHKLGRNATTTRPPLSSKLRQNGLITAQKLPVLTNKSNSSSRVNLPHDSSSRTGHNHSDGDTGGGGGRSRDGGTGSGGLGVTGIAAGGVGSGGVGGGAGSLPVLNNNKGENSNDSPRLSRIHSNSNKSSHSNTNTNGHSSLPLSPQEALKSYSDRLTEYERREIEAYPEIYYLGLDARKIHGEEGAQLNGGYDDENGSYNKVMHDHISYRYEILEVIGKGSFGQVIRAVDHKTGDHVAIKIIRNKKRFHHQALVEVKILDHLRRRDGDHHHNIIHMLDYFYFRNHLCITFELMGLNLYELIKKNNYQGFSLSLIKRFAFSLVQCLKLLNRENIIHCDLKPENVLLKQRGSSSIRIIDFGSSCYVHQRVYTYIQSRFYRSPEVILGLPYGLPIDMWSLGCILAELYTGYPLFPGENEVEQLACIMEVLALPPHHLLIAASRRRLFFDSKGNPRCVTNSKGKKRRPGSRDLASVLKCSDSHFVHFIARCLEWDPNTRMTPEEALQHEWLHSSLSSTISSTTSSTSSASTQAGTGDRRQGGSTAAGGTIRRQGPITQDSTEDENYTLYTVYKGKRHRDTSTLVGEAGGKQDAAASTNTNTSATNATTSNGNHPEGTSAENSLDDSGTYLPPIL